MLSIRTTLFQVRYVFEGLGHLISQIFIHSASHITKINDNGKEKDLCLTVALLNICRLVFRQEKDVSQYIFYPAMPEWSDVQPRARLGDSAVLL